MPDREEQIRELEGVNHTIVALEGELTEARRRRNDLLYTLGRQVGMAIAAEPSLAADATTYHEVQVSPSVFTPRHIPHLLRVSPHADGVEVHVLWLYPEGRELGLVERSMCGMEAESDRWQRVAPQEDAVTVELCEGCTKFLREIK